jgi:LPXTG-motif cell wall-anchored protein
MASSSRGDGTRPQKMTEILSNTFLRPAKPKKETPIDPNFDPDRILPPEERKAAMDGLDPVELKWSRGGLVLTTVVVPLFALYKAANFGTRITTVNGHKVGVPVQASWLTLGGILLLFCILGFVALRRRKRTLVAFTCFILGLGMIPLITPLGFALIILGGWLMMRAYRMNKYGTSNAKLVAKQAASRPPRRERRAAASAPAKPDGYKAPTRNARYTPPAPKRKKVPKPTE